MKQQFRPGKHVRFNSISCSQCIARSDGAGGNSGLTVCSQHGAMVEHDINQNTALGKVASRLSAVEAIVEPIPKLLREQNAALAANSKKLDGLLTDKTKLIAFIAGVSGTVTVIVLGFYYAISAAIGAFPILKGLFPKGGG